MIGAVVLAAGRSRRMGRQKLLLPWAGQTVIGHIVDQVRAARVAGTVVVTGADAAAVAAALAGHDVTVRRNPRVDGDMLSSLRCGLRALPSACEAVLVALGDQPGISTVGLDGLIRLYETRRPGILVPTYGGRRGHPLLFHRRYVPEVLNGLDGIGLRGLLATHPEAVLEHETADPGVLIDLDTPEDYRRADSAPG